MMVMAIDVANIVFFFFSSRRRHTRLRRDWSSDVCSSDLYVIGVDVGGTFTDVFFLDEVSGHCQVAKVPSTPADQSQGFIDGIRQKLTDFAEISTVVHGTTVGTNALLERKGACTGIITTKGFRDVLEMRRRDRPHTWGL